MLEYKRVKKFPQAKEIVIEISYFKSKKTCSVTYQGRVSFISKH